MKSALNAGVKLIGILDYATGQVYCEEHDRYDAAVFEGFFKNILSKYTTGKPVMLLDNTRIHHVKLLKGILDENKNQLELVLLSAYSSELYFTYK